MEKYTNRQYESDIRLALATYLGKPLESLEPNVSFTDSIVYTGRAGERSVIFKMIDPAGIDEDIVVQEAWCYNQARAAGLPAPQVFRLDESCTLLPAPYMLVEKVSGSDLRAPQFSDEEIVPYLLKMGEATRALHTIPVEGYGPLVVTPGGSIRGRYTDWPTAALASVEPAFEKLRGNPHFSVSLIKHARNIIDRYRYLLETVDGGCLLHGDLGLIHFFADLQSGELTGIIDFGECKAGDPIWDFVDYRWRYVSKIAEGYGIKDQQDFDDRFYYYAILRDLVWTVRWNDIFVEDAASRMTYVITKAKTYFDQR